LNRFIRYLYEYENEKRIRNVGFIKVETGSEETIVHLQAKGFHNWEERRLVLYLFFEESGKICGIRQAEMNLTSPVLSWHYGYTVEDAGGEDIYSKICGILIETQSGRRMAATWDDKCVDVGELREFDLEIDLSADVHEGEEDNSGAVVQRGEELSPGKMEPESAEESEGAVVQRGEELSPEKMEPETEESARPRILKITRQDISKLPRCEWKLANNKFLMHGYNNFHHLLLIDNGNYLKLGVPGIYHIEEAKCANAFGFGEFVLAEELESDSESEENQEEMFGYWCRPVRRHRNL